MTTELQRVRAAALQLAQVRETTHFRMPAFTVAGRSFASLKDERLQLRLAEQDVETLLAQQSGAERISTARAVIGASVPVADLGDAVLLEWLGRSWRHRAPAALGKPEDAPRAVGSLPDLPAPAQRALAASGVTSLADVCARSRAELLALHGVGPKAIRVLQEAIDGAGLRWQ